MSNRKVDKRVLAESIGIGLAAGAGTVVGTQLVTGMLLTKKYVPDIVKKYESVDYLQQHTVYFGESGSQWPFYAAGAAAAIVLGAVYYGVRCKYRRQSEPRS